MLFLFYFRFSSVLFPFYFRFISILFLFYFHFIFILFFFHFDLFPFYFYLFLFYFRRIGPRLGWIRLGYGLTNHLHKVCTRIRPILVDFSGEAFLLLLLLLLVPSEIKVNPFNLYK